MEILKILNILKEVLKTLILISDIDPDKYRTHKIILYIISEILSAIINMVEKNQKV